ncbi:MAG: hypothetical protein Q7S87_01065 [Agitococcus sp.]|nr:hypothetical protein [Agitococcus sp.]
MLSAIQKAESIAIKNTEANAVKPIVEFFKLEKCLAPRGGKFELFSVEDDGSVHLYLSGLRAELEKHHGVYVFSDSRGHAIYVGKARQQSLWKEMNLAFNRNRGEVQKIKKVRHPARNQAFKTSEEKRRQIQPSAMALHEIAVYFSAYQVADGMVNELEAMLVRSFANDLLNIRMEHFCERLGGK